MENVGLRGEREIQHLGWEFLGGYKGFLRVSYGFIGEVMELFLGFFSGFHDAFLFRVSLGCDGAQNSKT